MVVMNLIITVDLLRKRAQTFKVVSKVPLVVISQWAWSLDAQITLSCALWMKGTKRGKVKRQQKLFDGLLARVVELKIVFLGLVSKSTETSCHSLRQRVQSCQLVFMSITVKTTATSISLYLIIVWYMLHHNDGLYGKTRVTQKTWCLN